MVAKCATAAVEAARALAAASPPVPLVTGAGGAYVSTFSATKVAAAVRILGRMRMGPVASLHE
jgi:hypothetical protein